MNKIKYFLKIVFYPIVLLKRFVYDRYANYLKEHDLKKLAGFLYFITFYKRLNWKNPKNLSEKINWMKFYSDTSLWTELADKYKVREYVEKKGLGDILVKLYGVWQRAEDIDFDSLPNSFVLKTNHACGTVLLVEDKSKLNIEATRSLLNSWLDIKMGKETAEPHYLDIKPLLIAEEFLKQSECQSLIDYKLYAVSGETELVMVCSNRKIGKGSEISLYDANWNFVPERLAACHSGDNVPPMQCPVSFEKMKEYTRILCKGIPFARMDFYDIDGKVYFGEMTFTPKGGCVSTLTEEESLRIGNKVVLPHPKNKNI